MQPHHLAPDWINLCRAVGAQDDVAAVGARLLAAYGAPTRRYHDLHHLSEVLDHVSTLSDVATDPHAVRLAAWFHDSVYDPARPDNERRSAMLAAHELGGLRVPNSVINEVARLVLLTESHDPMTDDRNGAVLCDCDLAVLGREPDAYLAYTTLVRQEYAYLDDAAFRASRAKLLHGLLERPHLFHTAPAIDRWESMARHNMASELTTLATD